MHPASAARQSSRKNASLRLSSAGSDTATSTALTAKPRPGTVNEGRSAHNANAAVNNRYALERRGAVFVIAFAGGCILSSVYGFWSGAWPFGVVELIWAGVAVRRYQATPIAATT